MGRGRRERLSRALNEHLNTIHETFQVLDQTPASSVDKVSWNDVVKLGEQISKQATTFGMLLTGETPEVKALEDNMAAYFNLLRGLILLSHGSTIGAGATLLSCIHASIKQVVDCSFMLLKEVDSSYESSNKANKLSVPQLVGAVWEACSGLKKTPGTNIIAIGRAMTQIAVSMKDVLREIKELKPESSNTLDCEASAKGENGETHESDNSSQGDLGNDLSQQDMRVTELATSVVSQTLIVIKELIRSITALLKLENPDQSSETQTVDSLERLLKLCQQIGVQIDELGACLYPPQEVDAMKSASEKMASIIEEMQVELENLKGSSEAFVHACTGLRSSLRQLESELDCCSSTDIVSVMENLCVSSQKEKIRKE